MLSSDDIKYNEDSIFRWWYDENIEELQIKWAETGADRELDFDVDVEIEKEWKLYVDSKKD